jgi:hypothetical protein
MIWKFFSLSAINETSSAHVGAEQGIIPICIPIPLGHTSLYRKLFLSGVRGKLWLLTYHLSQGAETSVKWQGTAMDPFAVSQDVRQGGMNYSI